MKSFQGEWPKLALALLATSAGCALVGYDLSGYKATGTTGAGGSASAGTPGSTAGSTASQSSGTGETAGPGGTGGSSAEGGSGGAGGSTSSGMVPFCTNDLPCNDGDPCTTDKCVAGVCLNSLEAMPGCCFHSVCSPGAPLSGVGCIFDDVMKSVNCVADICGSTPSCCSVSWTQDCVEQAKTRCLPVNPPQPSFRCDCGHSYCTPGPALDPFCDPCVHAICSHPGYESCCSSEWSQSCIDVIFDYCGVPYEGCQ